MGHSKVPKRVLRMWFRENGQNKPLGPFQRVSITHVMQNLIGNEPPGEFLWATRHWTRTPWQKPRPLFLEWPSCNTSKWATFILPNSFYGRYFWFWLIFTTWRGALVLEAHRRILQIFPFCCRKSGPKWTWLNLRKPNLALACVLFGVKIQIFSDTRWNFRKLHIFPRLSTLEVPHGRSFIDTIMGIPRGDWKCPQDYLHASKCV